MEIRIGNDIQIVTKVTNLESYSQSDVQSVECILMYTPFNHDCFHHHYTPTEYTIHGCGNPIYNVYPHQHKVWHGCAAPFAFKHIQLEYTLDLENGTITSTFESTRQFHCGMYSYVIKIELSENGYGTDNIHQYTLDFGEIFELSHCPAGSCGNVVVKTRPQYKVALNGETPVVPTYTCKFLDWNDVVLSTAEYKEGDTIVKPANPTRAGYVFKGWLPNVPSTMPAENKTFKATYTPNTPTVEHTVFYGTRFGNPATDEITISEIESASKKTSATTPIIVSQSATARCKWFACKTLQMSKCVDEDETDVTSLMKSVQVGDYTVRYRWSSSENSLEYIMTFE